MAARARCIICGREEDLNPHVIAAHAYARAVKSNPYFSYNRDAPCTISPTAAVQEQASKGDTLLVFSKSMLGTFVDGQVEQHAVARMPGRIDEDTSGTHQVGHGQRDYAYHKTGRIPAMRNWMPCVPGSGCRGNMFSYWSRGRCLSLTTGCRAASCV